MTLNPLAWQAHEYYDVTGCVELWQVDFVSGRTFTCRRIVFSSLEALQRSTTALVRAVALLRTDRVASEAAIADTSEESTTTVGCFHSRAAAVAFFADGREAALRAAQDIIADVERSTRT